jgi:uncharacterized membrane protein YecN with MAPEG domain
MHPNLILFTAPYAAAIGLLAAGLAINVIVNRVKTGVDFGDGGHASLAKAIRAHGNLTEHAPIALLLIALAELIGSPSTMIHVLAAALVVARLASAYGLLSAQTQTPGRQLGASLTILVDVVASVLIFYRVVTMMAGGSGA